LSNIVGRLVPYDDDYETCERTVAKLRIYGVALDLKKVTEHLCVEPSSSHSGKNDSGGRVGASRPEQSAWILSSEGHVASKDLRRHLDWLLDQIAPAAEGLRLVQSMEGVTTNVNCVWWSASGDGGPVLWPKQMRRLAELDLECSFDFAFYEQGDDSSRPG
jgi:hypothetical protein